jgi:glycosyltransferase involved in cell wall biosynthesis
MLLMAAHTLARPTETVVHEPPTVDVVVPTHNEEAHLAASVRRLHAYLADRFPFTWRITIADNGSRDATPTIARRLALQLPGVSADVRDAAGRGGALRAAWSASDATVVAYMDVDLSTDLDALLPLVAPLLSGHSDVAIGSRLAPGARTRRGAKREVISRCYNAILHLALHTSFRDAQCGFKALRADTARDLLPRVVDDGWFFDTELLVVAQRAGLRIVELPVDWTDDPHSRVDILPTALGDLRGVWRLLTTGRPRPRSQRPQRSHHLHLAPLPFGRADRSTTRSVRHPLVAGPGGHSRAERAPR